MSKTLLDTAHEVPKRRKDMYGTKSYEERLELLEACFMGHISPATVGKVVYGKNNTYSGYVYLMKVAREAYSRNNISFTFPTHE